MKDRGVEQRWTKLSTKNRGKSTSSTGKGTDSQLALQVAAFISNAFCGTANHGASTDTGPSGKVGIHMHPTIEDELGLEITTESVQRDPHISDRSFS